MQEDYGCTLLISSEMPQLNLFSLTSEPTSVSTVRDGLRSVQGTKIIWLILYSNYCFKLPLSLENTRFELELGETNLVVESTLVILFSRLFDSWVCVCVHVCVCVVHACMCVCKCMCVCVSVCVCVYVCVCVAMCVSRSMKPCSQIKKDRKLPSLKVIFYDILKSSLHPEWVGVHVCVCICKYTWMCCKSECPKTTVSKLPAKKL